MCRWLSYRGAPMFLEALLFEPEHSLVEQSLRARKAPCSTQGDGFGLGWYGERTEPGLYREILPAWNDRNLRSLAHQIRASLFFAHVRASTGTDTSRANCHPFAHGSWLFMHNGMVGGYDVLRRRLDQLIPEELYACRKGTTDSEAFFYLLFRHGLEQDPAGALRRTMLEIHGLMTAAEIADPLRFTAALSDGARVYAVRYASDGQSPSLYWREEAGSLIVVSEPLDSNPRCWNQVAHNRLLIAPPDGAVTVEPFLPESVAERPCAA